MHDPWRPVPRESRKRLREARTKKKVWQSVYNRKQERPDKKAGLRNENQRANEKIGVNVRTRTERLEKEKRPQRKWFGDPSKI